MTFKSAYQNYYTYQEREGGLHEYEKDHAIERKKDGDGHPYATTYTPGFTDCIDYIFHNDAVKLQ
jgi:mRNA deadenylase 3'-5' endonuclease subunit Ccr4